MGKKLFIIALGALLAVAFTIPAMAETKVDFSGSYRVRTFYINNMTMKKDDKDEDKSSYFDHRLRIDVKFMPSDALTMNVALNLDGNRWGQERWSQAYSRSYSDVGAAPAGQNANNDQEDGAYFEVRYYYMTIMSSIGKFDIGRQPGGSAGFNALGYNGSAFWASDFGDGVEPRDRIKYTFASGPLVVAAVYDKKLENDAWYGTQNAGPGSYNANSGNQHYDEDWDEYSVTPIYKFANGGAILTINYIRNHTDQRSHTAAAGGANSWATVLNAWRLYAASIDKVDVEAWVFVPAVVLNFGPIGVHGELAYLTGDAKLHWREGHKPALGEDKVKAEGLQYYLDATFNYGPGYVGLQYYWLSGDKTTTDWKVTNALGSGGDFTPFFIAYDRGPAPAWAATYGQPGAQGVSNAANHWGLGLWADHSLTEDLMIHAALGYFEIVDPGRYWSNVQGEWYGINSHFGTEFDLSVKVNIMPGLTFVSDAGYFWAGGYWKGGRQPGAYDYAESGDGYAWRNTLTIAF